MSSVRRVFVVIGLIILVASLALLVAANWPNPRVQERQELSPDQMTLPTPAAMAPMSPSWLAVDASRELS